nr:unnamed protein product [Callosobruchus chinensis]
MPKRKRCVSDRDKKLLKLKHKIRKLERQRRHRSPSSSGSNSPSSQNSRSPLSSREVSPDGNGLSGVHKDPAKTYRRRIRVLSSSDEEFYIEGERQRGGNNEDGEDQDPLDENLLELLGPNVSLNEVKGSNIQKDLAVRWEAILRQGVSIEDKNSIINDYPIPENCQALNPPRLNRIVSAAITDSTTRRVIKLSLNQTQIGAAVSAVGIAITALLKDKKEEHKSIIKQLSDAGRLMADLFYNQSQCRRELLLFNLNKDLKETLEKTEPSSWLFGDNLEEEIKTTKTLQRTTKENFQVFKLKKSVSTKQRPYSGQTEPVQSVAEVGWVQPTTLSAPIQQSTQHDLLQPSATRKEESPSTSKQQESIKVSKLAGRLSQFLPEWQKITSDKVTLSYVSGLSIPFSKRPLQKLLPREPNWSLGGKIEIEKFISKLTKLGAVSKVVASRNQFISNIFLTPKKDGSKRLIINLKALNGFVINKHFKLEDHKTVARLIKPNCFMSTIDLKDAYFLLPVKKSRRKYLRFRFKGTFYEFNCLPFGLSCAPRIFTKLLKPVLALLRAKGLISNLYLDDFLLMGNSFEACQSNVKQTIEVLEKLGFIINYPKSSLIPKQNATYLGFLYNSSKMSISLPVNKQIRIKKLINKFQKKKTCIIRDFAKLVGTLVSCCSAIPYSWLYIKSFEREKYIALRANKDCYNAKMSLNAALVDDFIWWSSHVSFSKSLSPPVFVLEIFSDASTTGWGIFCNGQKTHGYWTDRERSLHINCLELLAAIFGLKCFASEFSNSCILCRIDNTTAIACINRMGSVQYPKLNKISNSLWKWLEKKNLYVFASYIKSSDNLEADKESRSLKDETEFELNPIIFNQIVNIFGKPQIDLFASRDNTKCDTFISWRKDPDSLAVDAFTLKWRNLNFYAFPPFSQILRVLQKIEMDQAEGIVVVPRWVTQPWYPHFMSLLKSEPIYFSPKEDLISCFSNRHPHSLGQQVTLVVGFLSARL